MRFADKIFPHSPQSKQTMFEQIERLDHRSKTQSKQIFPANLHDYNTHI